MNDRLKELEERANKHAKRAENISLTSSTKINYDDERDAMRFHVKWISFC